MTDAGFACPRQQELMEVVQGHLMELSRLAREEVDVLKTRDEPRWLEIDRLIEKELGEKERALGALREHRHEHGC
jgi:hypothetical protein